MTQAEYQRLSRAVYEYNDNPKKFTDTEAKQIARVAQILGLPFQPESKALQKFFFDLADTALFGLLPEDQRPVSRGEEVFGETRSEKVVSTVANLLGFLVPGTAGIKVGQKIAPALLKKADACCLISSIDSPEEPPEAGDSLTTVTLFVLPSITGAVPLIIVNKLDGTFVPTPPPIL